MELVYFQRQLVLFAVIDYHIVRISHSGLAIRLCAQDRCYLFVRIVVPLHDTTDLVFQGSVHNQQSMHHGVSPDTS
jgi:hypothetical protein